MSATITPPLKAELPSEKPVQVAFWRGLLNTVFEEGRYIGRALGSWPLATLIMVLSLGLLLAYQAPVEWQFQLGLANRADYLYVRSFNPPDPNGRLSFRWTTEESYLRFPGAGRLPAARLEIEMQPGGRPPQLALPRVQVWEGARLLGEVEVRPDQPRYIFDYRAEGGNFFDGNPVFTLKVLNAFEDKGYGSTLGVVVTKVSFKGGPADGRPVIPSLPHYVFMLAGLVIFYVALVRGGWTALGAAGLTVLPGIATIWALAAYRFHLTPAIEVLFLHLLLAYPLLVLGLRTTSWWLRRRGLDFPAREQGWLALIFVTAFVVKAAGLNHPAFWTIDHWFRVHQINRFWEYPAAFWQQYYNVVTGTTVTGQEGGSAVLGQWGLQLSVPYSPLFYLFAAPLSLIWPAHNDPNLLAAVNVLASWLEVSQLFLLYFLAKRAIRWAGAGRAGVIAAAIFGFYPLSFLLFSDGGYNSIFAAWLTLLFVALLVDWLHLPRGQQNQLPLQAGIVFLLTMALLAHTSTLLLVSTLVIVYNLLLFGRKEWRFEAWRVALLSGAGLSLASGLYYGWYLPGLLGKSLPALLSKLGSGSPIGQDDELLGNNLLTGFWPQLWEHYRLWPFLLTVGLTAYLLIGRQKAENYNPKSVIPPTTSVVQNPKSKIQNPSALIPLAWLLVFGLFALVDLRVNLLQKHLLFVAPLFCLGSGLALSLAWERVREWAAPRRARWALWVLGAAISGLLLFNFVQGLIVWYARVYYLTYQPGSG